MNLNFNLNPDAYTFLELSNLLSLKKNYNNKDVIRSGIHLFPKTPPKPCIK